ncbi:TetR/AcrR family transcriptional regulator [Gemmatimonas aurantiaca]|uniref:TetR/AcrR family transcriptional regulator n=1 Tax=Gemmatimonas aurantiaca TaxID=173480 RepID=UPI00301D4657
MNDTENIGSGEHRAIESHTGSHAIPATPKREPRQERGQRRVEEILDATEALILEVGAAACSVQELAKRSGASVGSIYHFFPTKEAIFDALRERYTREAVAIAEGVRQSAPDWASLDLETFIQRLFSPFTEFFERKPALYELAIQPGGRRMAKEAAVHAIIREAMDLAFARRWPETSAEERAIRLDVASAIGDGVSNLMMHAPASMRSRLRSEMPRAVFGYLSTFETGARH